MLKISLNICLLVAILSLISFGALHEPLSMTTFRYIGFVFFSSFFLLPAVIIFNGLLSFIRSLQLNPTCCWVVLITSILMASYLALSITMSFEGVHPITAELTWLIVDASVLLTLLIRYTTIHHLFKSFGHEKESSYSIG